MCFQLPARIATAAHDPYDHRIFPWDLHYVVSGRCCARRGDCWFPMFPRSVWVHMERETADAHCVPTCSVQGLWNHVCCHAILLLNTFNLSCLALCPDRCSICAEFSARCKRATTESERTTLESHQRQHLTNIQQYRLIQNRLAVLSETEGSNILKIDIDGLDQNKTRFPRNLQSSKTLANAWRPQLHCVGVIVWGVPGKSLVHVCILCYVMLLFLHLCCWFMYLNYDRL